MKTSILSIILGLVAVTAQAQFNYTITNGAISITGYPARPAQWQFPERSMICR